MERKQLILLVVAIAAGIIATVLTSSYISTTINEQTQLLKEDYEAKQREVIGTMQRQNEQRMSALNDEIKRLRQEQAETVNKQIAELKTTLQKQQAAQQAAVVVKKAKPSLALKTPAGKRAVTVRIDSLAAVGGLLNPGDSVDVIAQLNIPTGDADDKNKRKMTAMVFQGLEVLAVNTNLEETGMYYDEQQSAQAVKVTVAVDPEEAGLLSFADKNGKLELALRSPDEMERQMVKSSTWKTLADYVLQNQGADLNLPDELKEIPKDQQQAPAQPDIQIFRGGKEL